MRPIRILSLLFAFSLILPFVSTAATPAQATVQPYVSLRKHQTAEHFANAYLSGVAVESREGRAHVRLAASGLRSGQNPGLYGTSKTFYYGRLVSRVQTPSVPFDTLIASWNAAAPPGTWVQVETRAYRPAGAHWTKFYNMGIWAADSGTIKRKSVDGQGDADGTVATDTLKLTGGSVYTQYQYRLTLFTTDKARTPSFRLLSALTSSSAREAAGLALTSDKQAWGRDLDVPKRSQMIYPNGGNVWCSPTSTSMVMAYWGKSVRVPDAAAGTYDVTWSGTGNWPFNTAYAARFGLDAYVTRLGSLAQVEEWISAGVPVVISVAWKAGELNGAANRSSGGHIIVIRGFDSSGNVIVNDPAWPSDSQVRHVYKRSEVEYVWRKYSRGTVYIIHPKGHPAPADKRYGSW